MSVKRWTMVERSMWIADCPKCEFRTESVNARKPAKEIQCPGCKTWITYKQESFTSEEYKHV